jgi:hypothetical protein
MRARSRWTSVRTFAPLIVAVTVAACGSNAPGSGPKNAVSPVKPPRPDSSPGITADTITLGLVYTKNQEAGNEAIGAPGLHGDARDGYNVVIDEINRSGGIAGRKIGPIYVGYDATGTVPVDQEDQRACATWTQDHEVFAILDGSSSILRECADKAGAVNFWAGGASVPETFRQYPLYVETASMNLVRSGSVTVSALQKAGYFGTAAKIGLVTWDDPVFREAIEGGYVPALKKAGFSPAAPPIYVTGPQTPQDIGALSAAMKNAVLRFKSVGIDHVLLLDGPQGVCGGACLTFEFMGAAKAQKFTPRYGLNDSNSSAAGLEAGLYPPDQLAGAINVGWFDFDKTYDAGGPVNQRREACFDLMRRHSVDMSNPNAQAAALGACDELWFLQAVFDKMHQLGLRATANNFIAGVNALGAWDSPSLYAAFFSSKQHDGAAAVRISTFQESCGCFEYSAPAYKV